MRKQIQDLFDALQRGRRFVTHDVWHIGAPGEEIPHGLIIKHIRVAILLTRGVFRDDLLLRASALTFATILAIVPFLAITFFILDTFQVADYVGTLLTPVLGEQVGASLSDESQVQDSVVKFLLMGFSGPEPSSGAVSTPEGQEPYVDPVALVKRLAKGSADPKTLTIAGVLFVLTTVFGLMMNIESSFNTIWGLRRSRSWYRTLSDYMMILILLPFLMVGVVSVTAVLRNSNIFPGLVPFAVGIRGAQYVVCWLGFTALYYLVPNTRVRMRYAFLAGVVAGTLWCLLSFVYIEFQYGLQRYSILYAAFAQIPMLLMWTYSSWLVLLAGAELAFAYQNEQTFAMERFAENASFAYREAVGVWAMVDLGRRFDAGLRGLTAEEAAHQWNVPMRLLNETLSQIEEGGLLVRTASNPPTYQPSRSLDRITVGNVVACLREAGKDPSGLRGSETFRSLAAKAAQCEAAGTPCTIAAIVRELKVAPPLSLMREPESENVAGD